MPLTDGSSLTSASTAATSGPSPSIGTVTISMPYDASIVKCRSYPGTGQTKVTFSSSFHGRGESTPPCSRCCTSTSCIIVRLELPPATSWSGSTQSSSANSSRSSRRPFSPP